MNLYSKFKESANSMQREDGSNIDQASVDLVVAKIRRQDRLEKAKEFERRVPSVGKSFDNIFSNVFTLITGRINTL